MKHRLFVRVVASVVLVIMQKDDQDNQGGVLVVR